MDEFETALSFQKQGRFDDAERIYQKILKKDGKNLRALYYYALLELQTERPQQSIELLELMHSLGVSDKDVFYYLALAYQKNDQIDKATEYYQQCVAVHPGYIGAWCNLAVICLNAGDYISAENYLNTALKLDPNFFDARYNFSLLLYKKTNYELAYQYLLELRPTVNREHMVTIDLLIIDCLECLFRFEDVKTKLLAYDQALDSDERVRVRWIRNRICLKEYELLQSKLTDWFDSFHRYAGISIDLATCYFFRQQWLVGWNCYLNRFTELGNSPIEIIDREKLFSSKLLIIKEQGLGDELFLLRYLPWLLSKNPNIKYRSRDKMQKLLESSPEIGKSLVDPNYIKRDDEIEFRVGDCAYYYHRYSGREIPESLTLTVNLQRQRELLSRYCFESGERTLGVTWRSGTDQPGAYFKALPFEYLFRILDAVDGRIVILQRHPRSDEIGALKKRYGNRVVDASSLNNELVDMLCLLEMIDEYITVSNTNVHLRASLGKSAVVFAPYPPEWRWMNDGKRSPWFPNMTIFRQTNDGDWNQAITESILHLNRDKQGSMSQLDSR